MLLIFAVLCALANGVPDLYFLPCPSPLPPPSADWSEYQNMAYIPSFSLVDGGTTSELSQVWGCYTPDKLYIKYLLQDDYISNPLTQCNDPLYKYDAVEFFVAYGTDVPHNYIELEMSPFNNIFISSNN
jgi:hypothetical protein